MGSSESSDPAALPGSDRTRYVLLSECLQNDFFLNRECPIYLGDQSALGVLTARNERPVPERTDGRLRISPKVLAGGPLSLFLETVVARRRACTDGRSSLYVVNIRDWHEPGPSYDIERRKYGSHCEKGSWGAGYIDGLEQFLDPLGGPGDQEATSFVEGSVRICHIHSDSVFDFRPREGADPLQTGKLPCSELEDLLDILVQGRDEHVRALDAILAQSNALIRGRPVDKSDLALILDVLDKTRKGTEDRECDEFHEMLAAARGGTQSGVPRASLSNLIARLSRVVDDDPEPTAPRVHAVVIGAYSDVKILTLLGGLRARYDLPNLAVADTLSSSPTLERHISGLDFAQKVMDVEVLHGVNDLVSYLGGTPTLEDESSIVEPNGFARFQTFFKDKQNVLAYQSERLQEYLTLTEKRSLHTYRWIELSNLFLIFCGAGFLVATLFFAIWSAVDPSVSWALPAITGGLGLLQLVTVFFRQPMDDLNQNLANLMTYRMALESHSLKMALARFHLTTPHTLADLRTEEVGRAESQVQVLKQELDVIAAAEAIDFSRFASFRLEPSVGNGAPGPTGASQVAGETAPAPDSKFATTSHDAQTEVGGRRIHGTKPEA